MKKIIIGVIIGVVVGVVGYVGFSTEKLPTGTATPTISYNSASSTVYTIGHQLSTKVMDQRGGRGYANICNNTSGNTAYALFTGTAVTATTTANIEINAGECYEIDQDNLYTGAVHVISETGSTTNSLLVTELIR